MRAKKILVLAGALALLAIAGCRSAHVTSAILYIDQLMYDKAISVLHEGLDYSPDEAEAYFYLGEAHSKKAEEQIRENDFLEAKRNYSMSYDYYQKTLKMDQGLNDRVQESLRYNYFMQVNNATNEYQAGYYEAAEGYYRLAFAALPDSLSPIKNLARVKIQLAMEHDNDPAILQEALELLDQVLEGNPGAYELLSDKANVLSRLDRKDEAVAIYDKLLVDHPDDAPLMVDIANLSQEQGDLERAGDLLVRVMGIYETDDDTANDEDVYFLSLQAAILYADNRVLRYPDAIEMYGMALALEDIPEENTLLQKLQLHYKYGAQLEERAADEQDPAAKEELARQAREQFETGVNVGNALVSQYFESTYGYYYLALCYGKQGNQANFDLNMEQYRRLLE
ncbi:tetratricopeptide repeat protein [bacterium]|nr:tetratricopeptide repeat protein [bacterium]MBU1073084.1 tetratricopeptide repeat protein [bacterium]MBU1675968.1 tetratricopeptide repeat protein [bacterium]